MYLFQQKLGERPLVRGCTCRQAAAHQLRIDCSKDRQHPLCTGAAGIQPQHTAAVQDKSSCSCSQHHHRHGQQPQGTARGGGKLQVLPGIGAVGVGCGPTLCRGGLRQAALVVGLFSCYQHTGGHLHGGPTLAVDVDLGPGMGIIVLQNGVPAAVRLLGEQALRRSIPYHIAGGQAEHAEHQRSRRGKLHAVAGLGLVQKVVDRVDAVRCLGGVGVIPAVGVQPVADVGCDVVRVGQLLLFGSRFALGLQVVVAIGHGGVVAVGVGRVGALHAVQHAGVTLGAGGQQFFGDAARIIQKYIVLCGLAVRRAVAV